MGKGRFSGIEDAKVFDSGIYLMPGHGVGKILAVKAFDNRKKVECFCAELEIIECDNPAQPVGCKRTWMTTATLDSYMGDVKKFSAVASDCDLEEVDEAGVEAIVSADNPLEGTLIHFDAENIKTKAGKDFTKVIWSKHIEVPAAKSKKSA